MAETYTSFRPDVADVAMASDGSPPCPPGNTTAGANWGTPVPAWADDPGSMAATTSITLAATPTNRPRRSTRPASDFARIRFPSFTPADGPTAARRAVAKPDEPSRIPLGSAQLIPTAGPQHACENPNLAARSCGSRVAKPAGGNRQRPQAQAPPHPHPEPPREAPGDACWPRPPITEMSLATCAEPHCGQDDRTAPATFWRRSKRSSQSAHRYS